MWLEIKQFTLIRNNVSVSMSIICRNLPSIICVTFRGAFILTFIQLVWSGYPHRYVNAYQLLMENKHFVNILFNHANAN